MCEPMSYLASIVPLPVRDQAQPGTRRHERESNTWSLEGPTSQASAGWRQPRIPRTVEPKKDQPHNPEGYEEERVGHTTDHNDSC
ncbi:MAG: hypothetical protein RL410_1331 [Actinomycetota bacterium]|jgi:hypothetical protein